MISESQIQEKLVALGEGQLSLPEFEDWINAASVSMHRDSDPRSVRLASAVHHILADYGDGVADELRSTRALLALVAAEVYFTVDLALEVHTSRPRLVLSSAVAPQVYQTA